MPLFPAFKPTLRSASYNILPYNFTVCKKKIKKIKKCLTIGFVCSIISFVIGVWRSLVAHLNGVQGVASSNLVAPILKGTFQMEGAFFVRYKQILPFNIVQNCF